VTAVARAPMPTAFARHADVRWIQRDILRDGLAAVDVRGVDTVFHLAATKELGAGQDEGLLVDANERLTIAVVRATAGIARRFIHASTQMVYGDPGSIAVTEDFPLRGSDSSPYACSKVNAENWLRCLHAGHGASFVLLRFCGFVEGGGNIDYMIRQALRDAPITLFAQGAVRRDYLSAASGIEAFVAAASHEPASAFDAFNIGSGDAISTLEIARTVCDAVGSRSEIVLTDDPAPRKDFVFDVGRARRVLDFRPEPLLNAVRAHARHRQLSLAGAGINA
jgi:nucleoside-diphosphate-sugar epimerase